jgi:amino acid permease
MAKNSLVALTAKEGIVGIIIVVIITLLCRWAYFFLPPEFARKAQVPNYELLFTVIVTYLLIMNYKLTKSVRDLQKKITKEDTSM